MSFPLVQRKYGALRDHFDRRDLTFQSTGAAPKYKAFSLQEQLGPVKDQQQEGSCTGNAGAGFLETLIFNIHKERVVLSPAFIYYLERQIEGSLPEDAGAQSRTIFQVLNKYGCCVEVDDPYKAATMNNPPLAVQLADAATRKIGAYHRVISLGDIYSCIASSYCCTLAIAVYESFEFDAVANTGIVPLPNKSTEANLGGHEIYAWGYDLIGTSPLNKFKVPGVFCRNSWGAEWGLQGDFILPLKYFADADLWQDSWVGHFGGPWVPKG